MNIGERIRELRTSKGITATFVAKSVGLSPATLSEIERDKNGITVKNVIALSEFFGVTTDYILKGTNNENGNRAAA